jgi:energy-coupling factor transport system substrate-specific component
VTWQLAASTILLVGLAGGFGWYERRRPDARVVALVAVLAALAALGRIAFAAVPNVKPTTDIVLIAGYALGAGPGFAVGAVAGLTSNFFFGQGPWTPWQMAAWGAAGVIGAGLGLLTRRRAGRITLALACTAVGFGFTVVQDIGDWVNYSDHSTVQLGIYVGKGLGFDAIHAAGCLFFALAIGPALARSISRFAARLDVTWSAPQGMVLPVLLALALSGSLGLLSGRDAAPADAASSPAAYLLAAQNHDGGLGSAPGQPSSQLYSGWAALGLAADGISPQHVSRGGATLTDYLAKGAGSASDPGSLERTILAARAAGLRASSFGGRNLVAALDADFKHDGSIAEQSNLTSFAALALRAAGVGPSAATVTWLTRQHDRDGGYGYSRAGGLSDIDDTGGALEALAGVSGNAASRARAGAVAYIEHHQDRDGGFPSTPGSGSNAQSTAWAVQGLIAAGVNPSSLHREGAPSPLHYLRSLVAPDGHVRYSRSSSQTPVWVTGEALMALAGKPLPLTAPIPSAPPLGGSQPAGRPTSKPSPARMPTASSRSAHVRKTAKPESSAPALDGSVFGYLAAADALVLAPVGLG